jgi:hypothetical protein
VSVTLQQGVSGYAGTTDTYIDAWAVTSNFGSSTTLGVRATNIRSALLRFDLGSIPAGATVLEAKLGLYVVSRSSTASLTAQVFKVLRPFVATQATWQQAATGQAWSVAGCNGAADREATAVAQGLWNTTGVWYELNVTGLVQGWLSAPASNRGMLVQGNSGGAVQYNVCSSRYSSPGLRPRLIIRYQL